jgi:hypothetical protein
MGGLIGKGSLAHAQGVPLLAPSASSQVKFWLRRELQPHKFESLFFCQTLIFSSISKRIQAAAEKTLSSICINTSTARARSKG